MMPECFVQLEYLPMNVNGKVDRSVLPKPEAVRDDYIPPQTYCEKEIAKVWQEVLGIEQAGIHDNFFNCGGNSIKAIAVAAKLQKNFEVSMNQVFEYPKLVELAAHIKPLQDNLVNKLAKIKLSKLQHDIIGGNIGGTLDLQRLKYKELNQKYLKLDLGRQKEYKNILLTGGTGYLVIHILYKLLNSKNVHIYLIIRGRNQEAATLRLKQKFSYYFGDSALEELNLANRITIFTRNLRKTKFDLTETAYNELAKKAEAIFHTAANVRHYGHYQEFYQDNVQAVLELIKLAKQGIRKDFHHISTISVGSGNISGKEYTLFTEYEADMGQRQDNYYLRTKLEAEKAVLVARSHGVNCNIYRVGNISINSVSGHYQDNIFEDAFFNRLKAFINLGLVPDKITDTEFSFVDVLADGICSLAYNAVLGNETYNLVNPELVKLSEILIDKQLNLDVKRVSLGYFRDYLTANINSPGLKPHIENIMLYSGWLQENSPETVFVTLAEKTNTILKKNGFLMAKA